MDKGLGSGDGPTSSRSRGSHGCSRLAKSDKKKVSALGPAVLAVERGPFTFILVNLDAYQWQRTKEATVKPMMINSLLFTFRSAAAGSSRVEAAQRRMPLKEPG